MQMIWVISKTELFWRALFMKNWSVLCFCSWPLVLLLISLGFSFCPIFCVRLFLPVVNRMHNHGNYNLSPGKGGLTKHLMCCMHHSQEKVCPFTLAFKILLLVWNSWDWERNKNRGLSMEYHYGLQALIYLSGDQRAVVVWDSVSSLQGGTSIPHFSWGQEKKLSCFALLGYGSLLLSAGFSSPL